MSETLKQNIVEVDLQYYLSIFQVLQQDIENIKRIRTLLGEPVDLSIDLAPVDYDDEEQYLDAIRSYQNFLQKDQEFPLFLGFTKLFLSAFEDLESYFEHSNLSEVLQKNGQKLISQTRELKHLD